VSASSHAVPPKCEAQAVTEGDPATVVLVHGAWHGAWCWTKVARLLGEEGVPTRAVELPLTSFADDIGATTRVLAAIGGPIVLCRHSYGGAVVTEAGRHPSVRSLVYLAAFALEEGESPMATATEANVPSTDLGNALIISDDGTTVTLDIGQTVDAFFHDCSEEDIEYALARLRPMQLSCLGTPVGSPAWIEKPATYVVCTQDRAVHPELQRVMADRCAESIDCPSGHSPFFSKPDLVAGVLVALARA
jgi:pimeloyl-ACP methyl ester carboxylesterase